MDLRLLLKFPSSHLVLFMILFCISGGDGFTFTTKESGTLRKGLKISPRSKNTSNESDSRLSSGSETTSIQTDPENPSEASTTLSEEVSDVTFSSAYEPSGLGDSIDVSRSCEKAYLSKDGDSYGPRAKILIEEILKSPFRSRFLEDEVVGMEALCPSFVDFNEDKKINFWVAMFTIIANYESGCNATIFNTCMDGKPCGGDFQMPEDHTERYWRFPKDFRVGDMWQKTAKTGCRADYRSPSDPRVQWTQNARNNIACAVETMGGTLCGMYQRNEERCTQPTTPFALGYWQPIREGRVQQQIRNLPLCGGR